MKKLFILFLLSVHLFAIDNNTTSTPTNPLVALNLELNATSLNIGEKASMVVTGTFKDNTIKEVNDQVEWIITPSGSVDINGTTLTALKDNDTTTIRAKVGSVVSNAIDLEIYWKVDGYALPPEPDEIENNATLEGIDSNGNGVRDDVERKIYAKYPKKLHRELLLDGAGVFQEIMAQPTEKAKETQKEVSRIIHCEIYLGHLDKEIHSDDWLENGEYIKDLTFNTKERVRKYLDYNIALSGGNFASKPSDWNRGECSKETILNPRFSSQRNLF
ncbi:MAG: hypothetical protein P8Y49_05835 [Sulfurovaceae bacterium]